MRRERGNYIVGLFLVGLGGWLIASGLGANLPAIRQIWPVFLLAFGLALLARYSASEPRKEGLVLVGIGSALIGGFLFVFTFDRLAWREMATYWPVFPLIVGISFFAVYLAGGMRNPDLLVPAFAVGGAGAIAFPFTLGAVENELALTVARFWPAILLVLGLVFLFRPAQRLPRVRIGKGRKQKQQNDTLEEGPVEEASDEALHQEAAE